MKEFENKYGFSLTSSERIDEVDGTLFDMMHDKSGARLIYLDRRDENTTFCIAFKTTPTDDTGVFHILEHSVLCGSRKFPIKDPFNELVKGSLSTYLNALTSGDKTLYPVSSKNAKSFRGLVDVYLDAVFHPLALDNPYVFMQEGHRYEFDEDGNLGITGVVYNEMQGVYTTAEDYADYLISRQLQPGGTYSYDSGGHPDFIPDLTFEEFKRTHEKFYHPSNSVIFLDGDVELDEILPLIDSYLSEYEKREMDFPVTDGDPTVTDVITDTYPIEEDEDPTDKTRIFLSYGSFDYSEIHKNAALSIITESVADINSAPLTKRILDTGLCESFNFYNTHTYKTNALHVTFTGVKDGKEEELLRKYEEALSDLISEGLSRENLFAYLKRREFTVREGDSGNYPKGMVYMRACIDNVMFGMPASDGLRYEELFRFLYEKVDTDYYLDVLKEVLASARATLILRPDPTFAERKSAELYEKLDAIAENMSEEERARLISETESFHNWQITPDEPEKVATLPTLSKEDINPVPRRTPTEVERYNETSIVLHPLHTGGITYADMYFDVSDADAEDIHYLRFLSITLFEWQTAKSDSREFRSKTKRHLGAFYATLTPIKTKNETKLYFLLHHSCLDSEKDNALDIIDEYISTVRYDDREALIKNVKQILTYSLEAMTTNGNAYAIIRNGAKYSSYAALAEHIAGYEYLTFIKKLEKDIDKTADDVLLRLQSVKDKYLRRERLTVGITESDGLEYAKRLAEVIPSGGEKPGAFKIKPLERLNEAIAIPGNVAFTVMGSHLSLVGEKLFNGSFLVYEAISTHEILWNEIRVKNGAYGTYYSCDPTGTIALTSYRDPTPMSSIEFYTHLPDKIDAFLNTSPDLLKYIIGVFGESDTVSTPRSDGSLATKRYLTGLTYEEIVKRREDCLGTTAEDLARINDIVAKALEHATFTVVGPRDEIENMDNVVRVLEI